jgi:hypothetical protein
MPAEAADSRVVEELAPRVLELLGWPAREARVGPLTRNDFSACFWIDRTQGSTPVDGVYVKLPKMRLIFDRGDAILPLAPSDHLAAQHEYESLAYLDDVLTAAPVRFVRPRGFLDDVGAVITERIRGADAFHDLREWDRRATRGDAGARARIASTMRGIGESVALFHQADASPSQVDMGAHAAKLRRIIDDLEGFGVRSQALQRVRATLDRRHDAPATMATPALKGIDVRNLLWTQQGGAVFLDPGAMKRSVREADIARFLFTYEILYWGAPSFLLGATPRPEGAQAFLEGYGYQGAPRALTWFMLKEALKHWRMAYVAVQVKSWPAPMKRVLERAYIDRFYERLTARTLAALEPMTR